MPGKASYYNFYDVQGVPGYGYALPNQGAATVTPRGAPAYNALGDYRSNGSGWPFGYRNPATVSGYRGPYGAESAASRTYAPNSYPYGDYGFGPAAPGNTYVNPHYNATRYPYY
eukprot:NODE_770_length_618_cov_329.910387_g761_i0.p2 GENE.NODE_770_length_618_cov_329.910387_g761_i0~~NODE_770_length_618_cov_329.910387_g761_i0.p2  ORF type:complete len:129 (+),score=30.59 NODE_770_length_618_cov_329.910387_g761_i0:48-389(+)